MSIYSKNHTYLGNADKICRFIGRKYKSQFWPNISSRYISLYLWIYVPHLWIYITQEKWAKNLVDFFLISCQWNRREKWAKNLVDFFSNILSMKSTRKVGQKSCGFFSNILWIKSPRKVGQKSCGFFSNILWIFPFSARKLKKKISHSFFSTIFVGFLDKNCRFIAYKSTILVQETNKYR